MSTPARSIDFQMRLADAMRLHVGGKLEEAAALYSALLHELPEAADVEDAFGALRLQQGNMKDALAHFSRAHRAEPGNARFAEHLSHVQRGMGDIDGAVSTLEDYLSRYPDDQKMFVNFFNLCTENERFEQAALRLDEMLTRRPDDIMLHSLLMLMNEKRGAPAVQKISSMRAVMRADAGQSEPFYVNFVKALRDAGHLAEADGVLAEGLKRYPQSPDLLCQQASHLFVRGQHQKAIDAYEEALRHKPYDDGGIRSSIGLLRMMLTDLREGYEDYACRPNIEGEHEYIVNNYPRWKGEDPAGKRIILWTEQGVGDAVMFASLIPWLVERGADVTLLCLPKMKALFTRSFPQAKVWSRFTVVDVTGNKPDVFDYHLPMGELIRHALPHYTPGAHPPFLKADPARTAQLRARYEALAQQHGCRRIVGFSWRTGNKDNAYRRDIPLGEWEPLFRIPGILWVSLQYGDHAAELAAEAAIHGPRLFTDAEIDPKEDIDGLSAQMAALDEIVSIQNATVHMGGGLGVPTTLMLTAASDWRWGLKTDEPSKWYGSVRIERQDEVLEWGPVLARVALRLAAV